MKINLVSAVFAALLFSTPAVGAPPDSTVTFRGAAQSRVELAQRTAVALDTSGKPLFVADSKFLFAYAGNPSRRAQEWDPVRQRVRISVGKSMPLWLRCADLKPMAIACTGLRFRAMRDGSIEIGAPVGGTRSRSDQGAVLPGAGAIPACPGDPRCPRPGG